MPVPFGTHDPATAMPGAIPALPDGAWTYLYRMSGRKAWYHDALPPGWEEVDHDRGEYVECELSRKLTADLDPADRELIESYGEPPPGWIGALPARESTAPVIQPEAPVFQFRYRNHRGEVAERRVHVLSASFGSTEWHPEPQLLLHAFDLGKGELRDFAVRDILFHERATPLTTSEDPVFTMAIEAAFEAYAGNNDPRVVHPSAFAIGFTDGWNAKSSASAATLAADTKWRVGEHYAIHVYEGERPVATFHQPEDAAAAVAAVNEGNPDFFRMPLCDSGRVVLKPRRYEFFVEEDCAACEDQARRSAVGGSGRPDPTLGLIVKPLTWTEPTGPNSECPYDHVTAETDFGQFRITWKSWKRYDSPTLDVSPGGFFYAGHDLEDTKAAAQSHLVRFVRGWVEGAEGPALPIHPATPDAA